MKTTRGLAALALLALLAGCGDEPTKPVELRGEYRLVSVSGQPVPATVTIVDGARTITEITSGTLRLWPDETHTLVLSVRARTGDGPVQVATFGVGGAFTLEANSVALDLGEDLGTRTGAFETSGRLPTLTVEVGGGFGVLSFRKVE